MDIKDEARGDEAVIRAVTKAAFAPMGFSDGTEQDVTDALRDRGELVVSLVAVEAGEVLGHVAFSKVEIDGADVGWYGLGPVAVWPAHQRRGIGIALIEAGLSRLRDLGAKGCALTGDPGYYCRFGFQNNCGLTYGAVNTKYVQGLAFSGAIPKGALQFSEAFGE